MTWTHAGSRVPALDLLAQLRARRRHRDMAYAIYVMALVALLYVVPYGYSLLHGIVKLPEAEAHQIARAGPPLLTALTFALLGLAIRDGSWRGILRVEGATLQWLMSGPVPWMAFLVPRLRRTTIIAALASSAVFTVAGAAVTTAASSFTFPGLVACAISGATLGTSAVSLSAVTQHWLPPSRARQVSRALNASVWVSLAWAVAAAMDVSHTAVGWYSYLLGPAGWVAVVVQEGAFGRVATLPLVLLISTAAGLVTLAVVAARQVTGAGLRERSTRHDRLVAALFSVDTRQATVLSSPLSLTSSTASVPRPRRGALTVSWHVLTGWRRRPAEFLGGLAWCAVAAASIGSLDLLLRHEFAARVLGVLAAYRGCSLLIENVRLQTDDIRRSAHLPYGLFGVVWRALVLPTVIAVMAGGLGLWLASLIGATPGQAAIVLLGFTPMITIGAAVSACRGQMPTALFIGTETPFGNSAPLQVLLWWGRVPAVVAIIVGLALIHLGSTDLGSVAWWLVPVVALLSAAGTLAWLRSRLWTLAHS